MISYFELRSMQLSITTNSLVSPFIVILKYLQYRQDQFALQLLCGLWSSIDSASLHRRNKRRPNSDVYFFLIPLDSLFYCICYVRSISIAFRFYFNLFFEEKLKDFLRHLYSFHFRDFFFFVFLCSTPIVADVVVVVFRKYFLFIAVASKIKIE